MTVRTRLLLLLLIVAAAFVGGLFAIRRVERENFASVLAERQMTWQQAVAEFLEQQAAPLATMTAHLSTLEGAAAALLAGDRAWAGGEWDEKTLASYGASAVWVFDAAGKPFFELGNTAALRGAPFSSEEVVEIFARAEEPHFFKQLPRAAGENLAVLEVRGSAIRPSWDVDRTTPALGFFFGARLWDEESVRELPMLRAEDRITLTAAREASVSRAGEATGLRFVKPLQGARGELVAHFAVTNDSPTLRALHTRGDHLFTTLLTGALLLFAALLLLLSRSIARPLQQIIVALREEDGTRLAPLARGRSEFNELARLIQLFFDQRAALLREMIERAAAQEALHESEEMLRHSQKLEAVGRLAGGVAHDFNNLLTAIIGYADLIQQRLPADAVGRQEAQLIQQAGEQAAGLTRQLLAFSRKQLLQPRVLEINVVLQNLQKLLQRIIGEHIEIRTRFEAEPSRVRADAGQIEQVIINLGVNARDAMPAGGSLTIRTALAQLEEDAPGIGVERGAFVVIEVTDTGEGMSAETKSRIFEPFFTTKGPGKGTGLGLATVYGIVKQSGGGLSVQSELGRGTTFSVYLPAEAAPVDVLESAPVVVRRTSRAEAILLVEDEQIVRELMAEVLSGEGYEVHAAENGAAALGQLQTIGAINLLISDVVMPDMNGAIVAQRVRAVWPTVKVLFVSGYSESDMADQGLGALSYEVLQKPFTPGNLLQKVRDILDARAGSP